MVTRVPSSKIINISGRPVVPPAFKRSINWNMRRDKFINDNNIITFITYLMAINDTKYFKMLVHSATDGMLMYSRSENVCIHIILRISIYMYSYV